MTRHRPVGRRCVAALLATAALVLAACGGDDDDTTSDTTADTSAEPPTSADAPSPTPSDTAPTASDTTADASPASDPPAASGGSLVVAVEAETNAWRPGVANIAASGYNIAYSIFDPLVARAADGSYQPYLAESIEPNDDYSVWTLTLRDGVQFHDGTPLDADALLANFTDYLMDEESEVAGDDQLGQVAELAVTGPLTVEYRLVAPNAAFPDILTTDAGFPFSPTAAADDPNGENPAGTGPFKIDRWVRDSEIRLVRNENYWQPGLPLLDEITFRPIPDLDVREQALAAGDVDAMLSLAGSSGLDDVDGVEVISRPGNVAAAVLFNNTAPPFDDRRVRRALSMAIDTEDVMIVSDAEGVAKANQMFGPEDPYYSEQAAEIAAGLANDPEGAAAELQSYLDDPARSDGAAPGEALAITLHCNATPTAQAIAQLYQSQWNGIGVDVEIIPVESATLQAQARSKEYDAQCYRVGKEFDAGRALDAAFGPESSQNFSGFTHPDVTALLDELRGTADPATRVDLVGQISVILAEEVPQLYGAPTVATWGSRGVTGMQEWTFPDGSAGAVPVYLGTVMWGHVAVAD